MIPKAGSQLFTDATVHQERHKLTWERTTYNGYLDQVQRSNTFCGYKMRIFILCFTSITGVTTVRFSKSTGSVSAVAACPESRAWSRDCRCRIRYTMDQYRVLDRYAIYLVTETVDDKMVKH